MVGLTWCFSKIPRGVKGLLKTCETHKGLWIKIKSLSSQHLLWETVTLTEVCYSGLGKRNLICAMWLCMLSCHQYRSFIGKTIIRSLFCSSIRLLIYDVLFHNPPIGILLFLVLFPLFILYSGSPKAGHLELKTILHSFLIQEWSFWKKKLNMNKEAFSNWLCCDELWHSNVIISLDL